MDDKQPRYDTDFLDKLVAFRARSADLALMR